MDNYRPHNGFWNLIEDCADEMKVKHVLRPTADPRASYSDGRVDMILDTIQAVGLYLRTYEPEKWNSLVEHVL